MKIIKTFKSLSAEETVRLGFDFGREILRRGSQENRAIVVTFRGELGAGKTTFIAGMARGLGIKKRMQSPTFVFVRRFCLKGSVFENFFHIDAYRVKKGDKSDFLSLQKILVSPKNIIAVEWPQRISGRFFGGATKITMKHLQGEEKRAIKISC